MTTFPEATSLDRKSKTPAESCLCHLPTADKSPPFKSHIIAKKNQFSYPSLSFLFRNMEVRIPTSDTRTVLGLEQIFPRSGVLKVGPLG